MKNGKSTFAVFIGNRGFFPASLLAGARKEMLEVLAKLGHPTIVLDAGATRYGAVETAREGQLYANFLEQNRQRFVWRGQVRHLVKGEYWQRMFAAVGSERYQNGAYWATASGWMMFAVAQRDRDAARSMWSDLVQDFRSGDICECVNEGYRQLPSYVVSACNPLAAARRLKFE